jgi:hypothetical protein
MGNIRSGLGAGAMATCLLATGAQAQEADLQSRVAALEALLAAQVRIANDQDQKLMAQAKQLADQQRALEALGRADLSQLSGMGADDPSVPIRTAQIEPVSPGPPKAGRTTVGEAPPTRTPSRSPRFRSGRACSRKSCVATSPIWPIALIPGPRKWPSRPIGPRSPPRSTQMRTTRGISD